MKRWLARSTCFAAFFAVTAFVLAWERKLTIEYVSAITAIHAFVVARAIGDDYHERNCPSKDS